MSSNIKNLDRWAAISAQNIVDGVSDADKMETWITKALGVLQAQGVYACMLYLYANENDHTQRIRQNLWDLLKYVEQLGYKWKDESGKEIKRPSVNPKDSKTKTDVLNFYANAVATNIDILLLVRQLYEQTLIYARYHAKAAQKTGGQSA